MRSNNGLLAFASCAGIGAAWTIRLPRLGPGPERPGHLEGLTAARQPRARLDIRLLDACGDPVANGSTRPADCHAAAVP